MTWFETTLNTRVLVIDDEESIRDSFQTILCPVVEDESSMDAAADILFGPPATPKKAKHPHSMLSFKLDIVERGKDGIACVQKACDENKPYAAIFCDMRMPGMDGIDTIEAIRKIDNRAEVVFITAYSDYSLESITERTGANVGYFVKPFLSEEVRQLATKLVFDWNKARELEELMKTVTSLRGASHDMERLLRYLLTQICKWMDTHSAALLRRDTDNNMTFAAGVGDLASPQTTSNVVTMLKQEPLRQQEINQLSDGTTYLPIGGFGLAIATPGNSRLTPERQYLLQIFLEQAALAVNNAEMHEQLLQQQRLAAVGKAISYLMHDMRGSVGMVQMMMQILRDGEGDPEFTQEIIGRAEQRTKSVLRMFEDTLAYCAGKIDIATTDFSLSQACHDWSHDWELMFKDHHPTLTWKVPDGLVIHADRDRLERVLWNLTKNAIDAHKGSVNKEDSYVHIGATSTEEGVTITVKDNGPGIPDEIQETLFEPFVSQGKRGGTGFGLAIVKNILEAHQGTVSLQSAPTQTQFTLSFPNKAV